jgi:hypothetical protein
MSTGGKRQPSGYLIFCSEQREHQKAEFEKMKAKEIMQHLGAEWRKLSPQQQEAYKAKAPTKAHHDVSHKEDSKPPNKTTHHRTSTKMKSSIKRQARSKSVPKKKAKKIHRKAAHHQTGVSSSE